MSFINTIVSFYTAISKLKIVFLSAFLSSIFSMYGQETNLQKYRLSQEFSAITITEVKQDKIGYLWLATAKGLFQFDGNKAVHYSTKNSLKSNDLTTVFVHGDSILIGSKNFLTLKIRNQFLHFKSKPINKIVVYNDVVFVATTEGLYYLKEDYLQPVQINTALDFANIKDILFYDSNFYIATNHHFWKLNKLLKPEKIQQIKKENYTSLFINTDEIIAVNNKNELVIFKDDKVVKRMQTIANIHTLQKIKNEIWIASKTEGIQVIDAKNYTFKRKINKYNTDISSNAIDVVFKDSQNNRWLSTKKDGLLKITSERTFIRKPKIFFEDISVSYTALDSINLNDFNRTLQLESKDNTILFRFKTIHLSTPKNIQYRWKLEDGFSNWTSNSTANFSNLAAGQYTFSVQSKISENSASEIKTFSFYIDTPYYQKIEFIAASILILSLVIIIIMYRYVKRLNQKNAQHIQALELKNHVLSLEQKALQLQMNPHFIFNVLNGIKAAGNAGKTDEMNTTISKFATLLRSILNNSRVEEISLKEEVETLKNYIELEQKMSTNSFTYQIKLLLQDIDIEEILIPPMLLQPFIENSIKHGIQALKNGEIIIKFEVKNEYLHCSVDDNGVGIHHAKNDEKNHTSLAIQVNRERIENLAGKNSCTIREIKEKECIKGTRVWFKIPLKTDF